MISDSDLTAIEKPLEGETGNQLFGGDVVAQCLRDSAIEFVTINPGASTRGLQDSIVNFLGNSNPKLLLCLHEESAVAIAHGYAKVLERPMAALLHSNVGLMHATMAIFNAWCDRVPVLLLGATGPWDAAQRRPWIDWLHTSADQGALIRDYTKWDNQPGSAAAAWEAIARAMQISTTAPRGPTYVNLDSVMQEQRIDGVLSLTDIKRTLPAARNVPAPDALANAGRAMSSSANAVILAGRVSRSERAWSERVDFAERLGAKVITDFKAGAAFPSMHPAYVGPPGTFLSKPAIEALRAADLIVSLDWIDLAGTIKQAFGDKPFTGTIVNISPDGYSHRGWSMDYQALPLADHYFMCEPDDVVAALLPLLPARAKPTADKTAAAPAQGDEKEPLTLVALGNCLREAVRDRKVCVARLPLGWPGDALPVDHPLDYLGLEGGGGVGAGPGIAVGAGLGLRGTGRTPIAVMGDGDFLMGATALWTGAHYRIPCLIIVANNSSYHIDESHQERVARHRGRPVENKWIGQRIDDPPIDISMLSRSQGAQAMRAETRAALADCLRRGLAIVDEGGICVIDAAVRPGDSPI
jgi:thiamine pyrophosphate-dependent acetolactate synthase large subunit-like protein